MNFYILEKSVIGYKNMIKNRSSQDYLKVEKINEGLICTIADGHSGDFFTQSHKGSKFACEAAINVIKKYVSKDINEIDYLLENKVLQKEICDEWRFLVNCDIEKNLPRVFKYNYFKYGTTLLAVLLTEQYILYIKLGDGDILLKKDKQLQKILQSYNTKLVDCIAEDEAYEKIIYKIEENKKDISDIIIFSDGFENSFISYNDMIENIDKTILAYKKSVFSRYILEKNYEKYLKNLSENNSLDDISIIFVNIF